MKKIILFSILLVILAAFFTSSSPDGLEKVAEKLGFIDKGIEQRSILTDYSLPFLKAGPVNTAAAGVAGVGLILVVFYGIKIIMSHHNQQRSQNSISASAYPR